MHTTTGAYSKQGRSQTVNLGWVSTSGGQERNISSVFLIFLLFSPIFPQFFDIFFPNLVLRVSEALATPLIANMLMKKCAFLEYSFRLLMVQELMVLDHLKNTIWHTLTVAYVVMLIKGVTKIVVCSDKSSSIYLHEVKYYDPSLTWDSH